MMIVSLPLEAAVVNDPQWSPRLGIPEGFEIESAGGVKYDSRRTELVPVSSIPMPPEFPPPGDDDEDPEEENRAHVAPVTSATPMKGQSMHPILEQSRKAHEARVATNMPKVSARHGVAAIGSTATEKWNNAVAAEVAKGKDRAEAIRSVNRSQPGLRQEMLAEVNRK